MTSPGSARQDLAGTPEGREAAAPWQVPGYATEWAGRDGMRDLLDLPRRIAAAVIASDGPAPALVVDAGSGPGDVLAAFLDEFPGARGIWTDASEEMRGIAEGRLARFGDRVEYRIADMTDLAGGGVPAGADVITTSRASHHLDPPALAGFYAQAAALLRPGGWLVNIDHVGPDDAWDKRLRAARKRLVPSRPGPGHHHRYPLPSVRHHLDGYAAAGIGDVEVAWRAFVSCLFMGRAEG